MSPARGIPWVALVIALLGGIAWGVGPWALAHVDLLRPCLFKSITGLPCLTCGLTRCSLALLQGQVAEAFRWHPLAVILVLGSPLAVAWDLLRAWRGRPYPALPDRLGPRLALAGLLAGAWILQIVRGI